MADLRRLATLSGHARDAHYLIVGIARCSLSFRHWVSYSPAVRRAFDFFYRCLSEEPSCSLLWVIHVRARCLFHRQFIMWAIHVLCSFVSQNFSSQCLSSFRLVADVAVMTLIFLRVNVKLIHANLFLITRSKETIIDKASPT